MEFIARFGKTYTNLGQHSHRFKIFKANLDKIKKHNSDQTKSYKLGINRFSDMSEDEFLSIYGTLNEYTEDGRRRLDLENLSRPHHYKPPTD